MGSCEDQWSSDCSMNLVQAYSNQLNCFTHDLHFCDDAKANYVVCVWLIGHERTASIVAYKGVLFHFTRGSTLRRLLLWLHQTVWNSMSWPYPKCSCSFSLRLHILFKLLLRRLEMYSYELSLRLPVCSLHSSSLFPLLLANSFSTFSEQLGVILK